MAAAGRRGILVSDTRVLETIRGVHTVILDKTGTATYGEFALLESTGDTTRMAELAAFEAWSEHPISQGTGGAGRQLAGGAGRGDPRRSRDHRLGQWRPIFSG